MNTYFVYIQQEVNLQQQLPQQENKVKQTNVTAEMEKKSMESGKETKKRAKPEIVEHIVTLRRYSNGWRKELNVVSWNGGEPVFDIRAWSKRHNNFGRGVSFTDDEWDILTDFVDEWLYD